MLAEELPRSRPCSVSPNSLRHLAIRVYLLPSAFVDPGPYRRHARRWRGAGAHHRGVQLSGCDERVAREVRAEARGAAEELVRGRSASPLVCDRRGQGGEHRDVRHHEHEETREDTGGGAALLWAALLDDTPFYVSL